MVWAQVKRDLVVITSTTLWVITSLDSGTLFLVLFASHIANSSCLTVCSDGQFCSMHCKRSTTAVGARTARAMFAYGTSAAVLGYSRAHVNACWQYRRTYQL
jgi:hypothetical protein